MRYPLKRCWPSTKIQFSVKLVIAIRFAILHVNCINYYYLCEWCTTRYCMLGSLSGNLLPFNLNFWITEMKSWKLGNLYANWSDYYLFYYSFFTNITSISSECMRHDQAVVVNGVGKMRTSINTERVHSCIWTFCESFESTPLPYTGQTTIAQKTFTENRYDVRFLRMSFIALSFKNYLSRSTGKGSAVQSTRVFIYDSRQNVTRRMIGFKRIDNSAIKIALFYVACAWLTEWYD